MSALLGAVGLRGPNEARFFGFIGGFAIVVTIVYWFVSYEPAGTALLGGFALVTALLGWGLSGAGRRAVAAGGADPERPLDDESGRLPSPTLAPFALAIGLTVAMTSIVFGPAPLLVGAPPALWGAITWLYRAIAELRAVSRTD